MAYFAATAFIAASVVVAWLVAVMLREVARALWGKR